MVMPTNSRQSSRKGGNDFTVDPQLIVEERIVKVNGEITVRKYAKGRFLGKVIRFSMIYIYIYKYIYIYI